MEYKDYYKILGLERTATQDEVKRAYRKLARKYHPDINKEAGAEDKFKEIGEANDVLSDVEKRAAYDQLGMNWQAGQNFTPPPNWDEGFEFSGAGSGANGAANSDFFESLFGRMGGARGSGGRRAGTRQRAEFNMRGEDHHAKIEIDLKDTLEGATRSISLRAPELDASGHVVMRDRTLNVKIPKGILEGQTIRLKGQGTPGIGKGDPGDLYLEIVCRPDQLYRVSGKDLYMDLPVAPWEAALGAEVETPTPKGTTIKLKIPPGSAQGRPLRVRGYGIPSTEPGDFYAVLKLVLPPADTETARKLYEQMARELAFDPRANLKSKGA